MGAGLEGGVQDWIARRIAVLATVRQNRCTSNPATRNPDSSVSPITVVCTKKPISAVMVLRDTNLLVRGFHSNPVAGFKTLKLAFEVSGYS